MKGKERKEVKETISREKENGENERKQKEAEEMWPEMRDLSYRDLRVVRHACASSTC